MRAGAGKFLPFFLGLLAPEVPTTPFLRNGSRSLDSSKPPTHSPASLWLTYQVLLLKVQRPILGVPNMGPYLG